MRHPLTQSFEAARGVKHLKIRPLRVELTPAEAASTSGNWYVKKVWLQTMSQVWRERAGHGYDGDVLFLEDDLHVSPDFYAAAEAASRLKRTTNSAVFAMGGWAGMNLLEDPDPHDFVLKTWSAFPTMGYKLRLHYMYKLRLHYVYTSQSG